MSRLLLPLLAVSVVATTARAEGIKATVDRGEVPLGGRIVLTLTVEGSQLTTPRLPDLSAFEVYSGGTSRQVQIVNGNATSSVAYNYILSPKSTGTFTIGTASIEIGGKLHRSKAFRVKVVASGAESSAGSDLFLSAKISKKRPYVGEHLVYTMRLYNRVQIAQANLEIPSFDGFIVEELGEQRDYSTVLRGKEYKVTEIRRALFPQEAGTLTIGAAKLKVDVVQRRRRRSVFGFDPFTFGSSETKTQVLSSSPVELEVRSLPAAPVGYTGLVGEFKLTALLSKPNLNVGESTTLTITIRGKGNVQSIGEPEVGGLEAFKVYDDKPASSVDRSGSMISGSRTFRRALVPLQAGQLQIPPISLKYFDPDAGSYKTSRSRAFTLHVGQAQNAEELKLTELVGASTGKVAVRVIADDIRPIYSDLDALASHALRPLTALLWGGGALFPPLLFLVVALVRRRNLREASDQNLKRRRTALRTGIKRLAEVKQAASNGKPDDAAVVASRVLRAFVGDRLGVEGLALTPKDTARHLREEGVDEVFTSEVETLLRRCEAAQYGAATFDEGDIAALPKTLRGLMTKLDKRLGRRNGR